MTFTLCRATGTDAARIGDLFRRSFAATFGYNYPPADLADFLDECTEPSFRAELTDPQFATMIGLDDEAALLGYCTLGPQDLGIAVEPQSWVLRQLYLEERAKGTGLAQDLVRWAIAESRARGLAALYLTVWVENQRARRFYDRLGFVEVGGYAFRVGATVDDDRILKLAL